MAASQKAGGLYQKNFFSTSCSVSLIFIIFLVVAPTSIAEAWKPRHIDLYKQERQLGLGTYGQVFLAKSPTSQYVAVKKIAKGEKEGV